MNTRVSLKYFLSYCGSSSSVETVLCVAPKGCTLDSLFFIIFYKLQKYGFKKVTILYLADETDLPSV